MANSPATNARIEISCKKDRAAFDNGSGTNPAAAGGEETFTVQTVVAVEDRGIAFVGVSPAIDGKTSYRLALVNESGWKVCLSGV